jgi:hypothetical protein
MSDSRVQRMFKCLSKLAKHTKTTAIRQALAHALTREHDNLQRLRLAGLWSTANSAPKTHSN